MSIYLMFPLSAVIVSQLSLHWASLFKATVISEVRHHIHSTRTKRQESVISRCQSQGQGHRVSSVSRARGARATSPMEGLSEPLALGIELLRTIVDAVLITDTARPFAWLPWKQNT